METHDTDARAALDSIAESRRRLADRVVTPWWYHPALGIVIGLLMAAPSAHNHQVTVIVDAWAVIALGLLVRAYKNATGLWPAAKHRGPAERMRVALAVSLLAVYLVFAALEFIWGVPHATVAAGAIAVVLTIVFGRKFDERLRAELRGEA